MGDLAHVWLRETVPQGACPDCRRAEKVNVSTISAYWRLPLDLAERIADTPDIEIYELFVDPPIPPHEELEKLRQTIAEEIKQTVAESIEPVAKVGYFCTALAVSQAKALRNVHF
jgi:hypothetical protein